MSTMQLIKMVISIILIVTSIVISILVLKQDAKDSGLSAINGGNSNSTYWGKNKARSAEGRRIMATRILVFLFIAEVIALNVIQ